MNWNIVENMIKQKVAEGEFENLPGMGKPLPPDEFAHLPEDIRMVMRIMKNAGYDEEAQFIQEEMSDLQIRMKSAKTKEQQTELEKEYNSQLLSLNKALSKKGVKTNSSVFKQYQSQIQNKFKW